MLAASFAFSVAFSRRFSSWRAARGALVALPARDAVNAADIADVGRLPPPPVPPEAMRCVPLPSSDRNWLSASPPLPPKPAAMGMPADLAASRTESCERRIVVRQGVG
eukprot:366484-Chlamydomonas_euryale.AAC.5